MSAANMLLIVFSQKLKSRKIFGTPNKKKTDYEIESGGKSHLSMKLAAENRS